MLHIQIDQSNIFELRGGLLREKPTELAVLRNIIVLSLSYIPPNGMIESS